MQLREAIAAYESAKSGIKDDATNVAVTVGATEAIHLAFTLEDNVIREGARRIQHFLTSN